MRDLCPHHDRVLASWRHHWTHEDPDEHQRRCDAIAGQCRACGRDQ